LEFSASSDPDVLYYHEAMQAPDNDQFVKAMQDEIDGQIEDGIWESV
jgi:hypothetical protein